MAQARAMAGAQIDSFAAKRWSSCAGSTRFSPTAPAAEMVTDMAGRHVLVVVRGYHCRKDLAVLRPYSATASRSW